MNKAPDQIKSILIEQRERVAIAESVTAGDIQSALSYCEDTLKFFEGGITVYNVQQKVRNLAVNSDHAIACDGVSDRVAMEMARGVASRFGTEWGISITGYASPVPEKNIYELFAWTAFWQKGLIARVEKINCPIGLNTREARKLYVATVIDLFAEELMNRRMVNKNQVAQ